MTRKRLLWTLAAAAAVVAVIVLTVFQPQKLFIDKRVDEAAPSLAAAAVAEPARESVAARSADSSAATAVAPGTTAPSSAAPRPAAAAPSIAASPKVAAARQGMFRSLDHKGTGTAKLLQTDAGYVVRFEDFNVENGPDLFVYLSEAPGDAKESAFDDKFVSLGRLKGNQGNQNYAIPAGVDVRKYNSVVVWCKRFKSGFAAAPLG
ncbi:MAG: DM13 domain-containing protein [Mycobacteriales bacterium]